MKNPIPFFRNTILLSLFICLSATSFGQSLMLSNGSSGPLTVSATQVVDSYYHVTGISGNQISCAGYNAHVGDKVLIVQMTGNQAGTWQWDSVQAGGNPFTVSNIYRLFDTSYSISKIQVVKVPQYTHLRITHSGVLTALPWNDSTGGILSFLVRDTFKIDSGGLCNVNGLGFQTHIAPGTGGGGGHGGIGGAGNGLNLPGGDSILLNPADNGLGGGDGALYGQLDTAVPGFSTIPATNSSNLNSGITTSILMMGEGGTPGGGGRGGIGGGGGGGADSAGTDGGPGGSGGNGGAGGRGGGLIIFSAEHMIIPQSDTVFTATGDSGSSGHNGGTGGDGGNGGDGANCAYGGGGAGATGGNGGNGGNGGGGGQIYAVLFNASPYFDSTSFQSNGGPGGIGGIGGTGGAGGQNGSTTGQPCGTGQQVQAPAGANGSNGNNGSPGNDGSGGGSGGGGGGGGSIVVDCSSYPLGNNFYNNIVGQGCSTDGFTSDIEATTYGGDGNYIFTSSYVDNYNSTDYYVTVVDGHGCTANFAESVSQDNAYAQTNIQVTPSCPGANNGSIAVQVGLSYFSYPPCFTVNYYNYITDSLGNNLGSDYIGGLAPGTYNVYYSSDIDPGGIVPVVISDPTVSIQAVIDTPVCTNPTGGSISLTTTGNSCLSYSYNWSGPSGYSVSTSSTAISNLGPGMYTLSVTYDGNSPCHYSYYYGNLVYVSDITNNQCVQTFTYNLPGIPPPGSDTVYGTVCSSTALFPYYSSSYPVGTSVVTSCSNTTTLIITSTPVTGQTFYATICSGQSYQQGSNTYTSSGTYTDLLPNAGVGGCDSIATVSLTVLDPITAVNVTPQYVGDNCGSTFNDFYNTITGGDGNYSFNDVPGSAYCSNGSYDVPYTVYITDGSGCSGQYNTDLIFQDDIFDFIIFTQTNTSCPNSADGTFSGYVTDYTNAECNPTWTLSIAGLTTSYYFTTSGSASDVGTAINFSGLAADQYVYQINGTSGTCSQVTTGNFTIFSDNNQVNGGESDTICAYTAFYWNGSNYNQTGLYNYTFPGGSVNGCDSVATLNLLVFDPITVNATAQYVGGNCGAVFNDYYNYVYGGDGNYSFSNVPGTSYCNGGGLDIPYTVFITDGHGCTGNYSTDLIQQDDVFDFSGTGLPSSCRLSTDGSITGTVVDNTNQECNYAWNLTIQGASGTFNYSGTQVGNTINLTGLANDLYMYTISGSDQCSQVTTGYIAVSWSNNPVSSSLYDTVCYGQGYDFFGTTYTQSGTYTYDISGGSVYGCDSIISLYLTVSSPIVGAASYDTVAFGGALHVGTETYTQTGVYTDTLSGSHGCDSIVTIHLLVRGASTFSTLYDTICQGSSVSAAGHSYSANGTYTDTLSNATAGDSIVMLHLTVIGTSAITRYDTICHGSSVSIGGHSYTSSGVFADTLSGAHGCDSIVTLHLSVYPVASVSLYDTLITGDTLHIGRHSYYQSGVYYDTLSTMHGCDSAVTVYLYVATAATYAHLFDTVCQGFSVTLAGHTYTVSGTYIDTLTGHLGGDSIVTLSLTVTRAVLGNVYDTICQGSVYTVGSHSYSQSGVYVDTLTNRTGCDSIRALHLTVLPNTTPTASITVSHGSVSGGMQTDTFTVHYTDCSNPSYTWLLNNVQLSLHNPVVVISYATGSSDSVSCQISCSNQCSTVGTATSNSIIRTSIAEISSIGDVKIYPNPTTGSFSIDINALTSGDAKITITDLLGQIVTTRSVMLLAGYNKEEFTLGESAVTGVYMVELNTEGGSLFYRLILDK